MTSSYKPHTWELDVVPAVREDDVWEERLVAEMTGEVVRRLEREPEATELTWNWRLFSVRARRLSDGPWDGRLIQLVYAPPPGPRESWAPTVIQVVLMLVLFALGLVIGVGNERSSGRSKVVIVAPLGSTVVTSGPRLPAGAVTQCPPAAVRKGSGRD